MGCGWREPPCARLASCRKLEWGDRLLDSGPARRARRSDGCLYERNDKSMNDLRYGFRQLRKAPAFTITAVATVAICLGANLAIFAVIDSVLLKPLPFPHSDRLVSIYNTYPNAGVENDGSSFTNYYERRGNIPAFSSLSIY